MAERTDMHVTLTKRQREVLRLIARGKTNFEIANELGISLDGAKWHIREIMARLGCDTREEAVAAWEARKSFRDRVARAIGSASAVGSPVARIAVAGGVVTVVLVAVAAVGLANRSDRNSTAMPADLETPTAAAAPVSALTEAPVAVFPDGPVAFRSCGTSTFRRPAIAEMAQAFTNPRFAEAPPGTTVTTSERPGPAYFAYFLTNVYQIVTHAISANVESTALSGIQQNQQAQVLIPASNPCDSAFMQDYTINYYMFRFIDMVPKLIVIDDFTLTIHADLLGGLDHDVCTPGPSDSPGNPAG